MFFRKVLLVVFILNLSACDDEKSMHITEGEISSAYKNIYFVCRHESETLPPISREAEVLYNYGTYLAHSAGPKNYSEVARYYRLSSEAGNYKASTNLHSLISQGLISSQHPEKETIDIVEKMIADGIPGGYYDIAHYLELGYGVQQDSSRANAYFRKSADMGNPDAQFYVSKLLGSIKGAGGVALEMRKCALQQGHAEAALDYGGYMRAVGDYASALIGFQEGVRFGNASSASFLRNGFLTSDPSKRLYYLGQKVDVERSKRYEVINEFLTTYESLGATVLEIDNIVPLPPAKLPDWDGTFEWKKKRDSTLPPEKPSEKIIRALSQEKGLDPQTGLSLQGAQ